MLQIAAIGIIAVLLAIQFKNGKSEYATYIILAACVIIFTLGISKLEVIINALKTIQSYIAINQSYLTILIRILGITYIAELASNLCKDAGHTALSSQIELVGKLSILTISMPILLALLDTINQFFS